MKSYLHLAVLGLVLPLIGQEKVRDTPGNRVEQAEAELARAQEAVKRAREEARHEPVNQGRGGEGTTPSPKTNEAGAPKKWVPPAQLSPKRYSMGDLEWEMIGELIKPLMSPEGRAVPSPKQRFFILMDTDEAQVKVANFLDQLKVAAFNIQVDVEYQNYRSLEAAGIEVRTGPVVIENGRVKSPRGIDVDITGRKETETTNTVASITTISGHGASLWVSKTVVDHSFLYSYKLCPLNSAPVVVGNNVVVVQERPQPVLRDVGVSLYAKPTYLENGIVEVEIYPVVTSVDEKGLKQSFRVEKVETRLRVADGARLYVGGVNKEIDKFFASAFGPTGVKKSGGSELLSIYLTPHVKPVKPPPGYEDKVVPKRP